MKKTDIKLKCKEFNANRYQTKGKDTNVPSSFPIFRSQCQAKYGMLGRPPCTLRGTTPAQPNSACGLVILIYPPNWLN